MEVAENGKEKPGIHVVQENDTLWDLAATYNIIVEELKKLNPGLSDNLQLGQEVITSCYSLLLTVISKYKQAQEEKIPFKTESLNYSSLPCGTSKTIQQGEPGLKKVTYLVTAQNGKITDKKLVSQAIIWPGGHIRQYHRA